MHCVVAGGLFLALAVQGACGSSSSGGASPLEETAGSGADTASAGAAGANEAVGGGVSAGGAANSAGESGTAGESTTNDAGASGTANADSGGTSGSASGGTSGAATGGSGGATGGTSGTGGIGGSGGTSGTSGAATGGGGAGGSAGIVVKVGWPAPPVFTNSLSFTAGLVGAFKVTAAAGTLDSFGINVSAATGRYSMALYSDVAGQPGALISSTAAADLVSGVNVADATDTAITGTYWIAVRFAALTSVTSTQTTTVAQCYRNVDITGIDSAWPTTFGAASCQVDQAFNIWLTTYQQ